MKKDLGERKLASLLRSPVLYIGICPCSVAKAGSVCVHACVCALKLCDLMDYSPPRSSVSVISQARILESVH